MVWLVGTSVGKHRFLPNGQIKHMGVCETFVHNVQKVIHKTQIKLSLEVRNSYNSRNVNQRKIRRACPTGEKTTTY